MRRRVLISATILILTAVLGTALFYCLYSHDNKYAGSIPAGVTKGPGEYVINADHLPGPVFLVDGWEVYDGLTTDFANRNPLTSYIGEHSNFTYLNGSPYGEATYRLRLINQGGENELSLRLPELLSASRVYINGRLASSQGSLLPFRPLVRDVTVSFAAGAETEIVVQTANKSHYYSGMFFVPVLGEPHQIEAMVSIRLIFYGLFCFTSLVMALFSFGVWYWLRGDRLYLYLSLLCLVFALHVCYPFVWVLGSSLPRMYYAVEDLTAAAMILSALCFCCTVCGLESRWYYRRLLLPLGFFICLASFLLPLFLLPAFPGFLPVYSYLLTFYKLAAALFMMVASFAAVVRGRVLAPVLLAGATLFGTLLLLGTLSINLYEPVYTGWPEEYGGFFLASLCVALMIQRSRALLLENERLNRHLQEEVDRKTATLSVLLKERKHFLSDVVHDLKSPMVSVQNYVSLIRAGDVEVDAEIQKYLEQIGRHLSDMKIRISDLQRFSSEDEVPFTPVPIRLNDFLEEYHRRNQPDVEVSGADFILRLPRTTCVILGDIHRLQRLLENLVYNATGFVSIGDRITLSLDCGEGQAVVRVSDTGKGIPPEDLPRVFDRFFSRRADGSGRGLGLFIARSIAREHGGDITVDSQLEIGTTFTIILPLYTPEQDE